MRFTFLIILLFNIILELSEANSFLRKQKPFSSSVKVFRSFRGGSVQLTKTDEEENNSETEDDPKVLQSRQALLKYRMDQQELLQIRSTFLSEELAKRGLPMTTLLQVSTREGDKPPELVDWDCAMSTVEEPKVRFLEMFAFERSIRK